VILSRFALDLEHHDARRDLANPYDMHRTVKRLCGEETPLWRLESNLVMMQSETAPAWRSVEAAYFQSQPEQRPFPLDQLKIEGRELRFRLRANPTVSRREEVGGVKPKRGQRHSIYKEQDQRAWLDRQAAKSGFEVLAVEIMESGRQQFRKGQARQQITIFPCLFEGRLRVVDAEAFRHALREGLGSAKAFGMGLLSIAGG
jgi:CRISPR system Cascade subunit CasE